MERLGEIEGQVAGLEDRIAEKVEPLQSLTQRTEPALATLAVLQNEVRYVRETMEQIRSER